MTKDGKVYVGGEDGYLYALDSRDLNAAVARQESDIKKQEGFVQIGNIRLPVRGG